MTGISRSKESAVPGWSSPGFAPNPSGAHSVLGKLQCQVGWSLYQGHLCAAAAVTKQLVGFLIFKAVCFQVLCAWTCDSCSRLNIAAHRVHFYKTACAYACAYAVFLGGIWKLEETSGDHRNSYSLSSHSVFSV